MNLFNLIGPQICIIFKNMHKAYNKYKYRLSESPQKHINRNRSFLNNGLPVRWNQLNQNILTKPFIYIYSSHSTQTITVYDRAHHYLYVNDPLTLHVIKRLKNELYSIMIFILLLYVLPKFDLHTIVYMQYLCIA